MTLSRRSKIIIILILAIVLAYPVYGVAFFMFGIIFYADINKIVYPDYNWGCGETIKIENQTLYDKESLIEIAETAIRENYPDVRNIDDFVRLSGHTPDHDYLSIPSFKDNVVGLDNDYMGLNTTDSNHAPAHVVIKALTENNIQSEYFNKWCYND